MKLTARRSRFCLRCFTSRCICRRLQCRGRACGRCKWCTGLRRLRHLLLDQAHKLLHMRFLEGRVRELTPLCRGDDGRFKNCFLKVLAVIEDNGRLYCYFEKTNFHDVPLVLDGLYARTLAPYNAQRMIRRSRSDDGERRRRKHKDVVLVLHDERLPRLVIG